MKFPTVSDLKESERKLKIQFASNDYFPYPDYMKKDLETMLSFANKCIQEKLSLQDLLRSRLQDPDCHVPYIWDDRYNGMNYWGVPEAPDDDTQTEMARIMQGQFMYMGKEKPEAQLMHFFAKPIERKVKIYSQSDEYKTLSEKIFVFKINICPFNSSKYCGSRETPGKSWQTEFRKRVEDEEVKVWRLICCPSNMTLANFHDRIIGPVMGWARNYHSYLFTDNESGACFAPKRSMAVDSMHFNRVIPYFLDDTKYRLCHILRKVGDSMSYNYDLGDTWLHNIELIQIGHSGDALVNETGHLEVDKWLRNKNNSRDFKLDSVQLFAGEINCPPEDSFGCQRGEYGEILNKGKNCKYFPEAMNGLNWKQHNIKDPYNFNLDAHRQRLQDAMKGKASSKTGQKSFSFPFFRGNSSGDIHDVTKQTSEKVVKSKLNKYMSEKIRIAPDDRNDAICSNCGRQPDISTGAPALKLCKGCRSVWYCDAECQKNDWKHHKPKCKAARKERKEYQKRKEKNKEKKKVRKTTDKAEDDALAYLKKMQEASDKRLKETKPEAHAALQSIFKEAEEIAAETGADPAIQMLQTHFERRIRPRQIAREIDTLEATWEKYVAGIYQKNFPEPRGTDNDYNGNYIVDFDRDYGYQLIGRMAGNFGVKYMQELYLLHNPIGISVECTTGIRLKVIDSSCGGTLGSNIFVFLRQVYTNTSDRAIGYNIQEIYIVDFVDQDEHKNIHWFSVPDPAGKNRDEPIPFLRMKNWLCSAIQKTKVNCGDYYFYLTGKNEPPLNVRNLASSRNV